MQCGIYMTYILLYIQRTLYNTKYKIYSIRKLSVVYYTISMHTIPWLLDP